MRMMSNLTAKLRRIEFMRYFSCNQHFAFLIIYKKIPLGNIPKGIFFVIQ